MLNMINKKYLKIFIFSSIFLVILVISVYLTLKESSDNTPKYEIMKEEDKEALRLYDKGVFEVIARDNAGQITSYQMTGVEPEKDLSLEYMTEAEMTGLGLLPSDNKIQILRRNSKGVIMAYKIIKNDSDIVKKY